MKCFSVKQPWAALIVAGIKPVENRTRPTKYRGPMMVHAGATYDGPGHKYLLSSDLLTLEQKKKLILGRLLAGKTKGAIIGQANLVDCVENYPSPWAEPGKWHWVLSDARPFDKPVPYPGRLGLFDAPDPDNLHLFKPHDGRTRRVCITEEPCDVMITRPGKWGNPYKIIKDGKGWHVENRAEGYDWDCFDNYNLAVKFSISAFTKRLREQIELKLIDAKELRGLRLGCFCRPGEPCHGDVLVRMVEEVSNA